MIERQGYGKVKPVIGALFNGERFVAVGDTLHWSDKWKTFPDFLLDCIKLTLGREWWLGEVKKAPTERHQIVKWNFHFFECQKLQRKGPDGLYVVNPDGITKAFLFLAYDLYVLRHHQGVQDTLIKRLKTVGQFQGARYELFVAATLIRAGCQLEFEDESDTTRKHPELVATHGNSGAVVDVEAKSRHRSGVLGQPGETQIISDLKLGLHRLLNRGSEKARNRPFIIFVDMNLPPESVKLGNDQIIDEIRSEVSRTAIERDGSWPFSLAVVTNCPHHYGQFGEEAPVHFGYISEPELSNWASQNEFANALELAIRQYGNIPTHFPDDFRLSPPQDF